VQVVAYAAVLAAVVLCCMGMLHSKEHSLFNRLAQGEPL
jgi:hypothetical protein